MSECARFVHSTMLKVLLVRQAEEVAVLTDYRIGRIRGCGTIGTGAIRGYERIAADAGVRRRESGETQRQVGLVMSYE